MIVGYYSGCRPMMRTHVTLPRLATEGHIDILVDTGAQVTCILGVDAGIRWPAHRRDTRRPPRLH